MVPSIVVQIFFVYFGILRPAWSTFHSLESKNLALINRWLKYWIIFGIFQAVGSISNVFLGSLSFYDESKLVLAGCVWLTNSYGIVRFYEYIEPIFRFAEPIINNYKHWFYDLKQKESNILIDTEHEDLKDYFFEEEELQKELSEVMEQNWGLEQDLVRTLNHYVKLLPDPQTPDEAKKLYYYGLWDLGWATIRALECAYSTWKYADLLELGTHSRHYGCQDKALYILGQSLEEFMFDEEQLILETSKLWNEQLLMQEELYGKLQYYAKVVRELPSECIKVTLLDNLMEVFYGKIKGHSN